MSFQSGVGAELSTKLLVPGSRDPEHERARVTSRDVVRTRGKEGANPRTGVQVPSRGFFVTSTKPMATPRYLCTARCSGAWYAARRLRLLRPLRRHRVCLCSCVRRVLGVHPGTCATIVSRTFDCFICAGPQPHCLVRVYLGCSLSVEYEHIERRVGVLFRRH